MSQRKTILAVLADENGEVFEHPDLLMVGMNGLSIKQPLAEEMIPLPEGSRLFTIPGTPPIGFDPQKGRPITLRQLPASLGGGRVQAVSAFLSPGFTRTLLPAADYTRKQVQLPLWAYTAVGWCMEEERFYTAAVRVDRNNQWQPDHFDDRQLDPLVRKALRDQPNNRLMEQLARCAVDYHCFAAKNLFFRRWEAPLPTSPICNANCLGCISLQEAPECCPSSQDRIGFVPTVEELVQIAVPHLEEADQAIVSFGQGCEGDPILQADTICEAIRAMRSRTDRGTINFNTNASDPDAVDRLAAAGLDSMRISMSSVQERFYQSYHRPRGFGFAEVRESIMRAKSAGLFTMLNYLVFPGISDRPDEMEALVELVEDTGLDLIQMRNLNIDPEMYWRAMHAEGEGVGMVEMMARIKNRIPRLQYGYFNRTRDNFYPEGFRDDWPLAP